MTCSPVQTETPCLGRVAVEDVWGIGPNHARLLKQHGITTALQLREADDQWIRKHMGIVGLRLVMELRGDPAWTWKQCPQPKQCLTCSRAFGKPISTLAEMEEAVSVLYLAGGGEAAAEGLAATVLTVCPHHERIQGWTAVQQLADAVTCLWSRTVPRNSFERRFEGLRAIYRDGYRYKKAGVMLTGLSSREPGPTRSLRPPGSWHGPNGLMSALDAVNDRWGAGTLQYAASG